MTKITIHIGTEKTGTTSIQDFLLKNQQRLLDQKVLYPKSLLHGNNHIFLPLLAAPHSPKMMEVRKRLNLEDNKKLERFLYGHKQEFIREVKAQPLDKILISSEHLSSRIDQDEQVERIIALLDAALDDYELEVLVYLRPQDKLMTSYYSTSLKVGGTKNFDLADVVDPWFDYVYMLRPWEAVIGQHKIKARRFLKSHFKGGDIVTDYIEQTGIGALVTYEEKIGSNKSLSRAQLAFLRLFNEYSTYLKEKNNLPNTYRSGLVRFLEEMPNFHFNHDPIQLGAINQKKIYDQFRVSNNEIARNYFQEDALFEESFQPYDFDRQPQISVEETIFISTYVMARKFEESR